jgi:peptidoglycan/LPS O-acetylase OafA/YrhL
MASMEEVSAGLPVRKPSHSLSMNLDFLRTVAVLSVFFAHLLQSLGWQNVGKIGMCGVVIFFVHSSLVLMGSLQRQGKVAASRRSLVLGFWTRRFFRLYPLLVISVLAAIVFRIPIFPGFPYVWIGWKALAANLTMTQNLTRDVSILSPLWTLPLEAQMYIVLPFVYLAVRGNWRYRALSLWGLSLVLAFTLPRLSPSLSIFAYAPCFGAGILAFGLVAVRKGNPRLPGWVWPAGVLLLLALFGYPGSLPKHEMLVHSALALGLGMLYPHVKEHDWGVMQKVFHWIVERSYGIYLSHIAVFWVVMDVMAHDPVWVRVVALIAGSIGIPAVLYTVVEKPVIQARSRLAMQLFRPRVASAA